MDLAEPVLVQASKEEAEEAHNSRPSDAPVSFGSRRSRSSEDGKTPTGFVVVVVMVFVVGAERDSAELPTLAPRPRGRAVPSSGIRVGMEGRRWQQ